MNLNIQIFGTLKCRETGKAVRYFKERGIKVHFVDLNEKGMSAGELDNICRNHKLAELLDTDGKEFRKLNLKFMVYDERTILLENPLLFVTPIVRNGKQSAIGFQPEIWKRWIDESKQEK